MSGAAGALDRYLPGASAVHRADPRVKAASALGFILALTTLPPGAWPAYGAMLAFVWAAVAASRLGALRILRRSFLALPFVAVALPSVFTRPGEALFELNVGVGQLTATGPGAAFFVSVLLKSWIAVTAAALLTATTPFVALLEALRWLRVPPMLVAIASFMYRYLFVLVDEAQRMLRARAARSASAGLRHGGSVRWRARVAGGMAGSLFLRTYDRSERVYMAMAARGYDGRVRSRSTAPLRGASIARLAGALAAFAAVAALARLFS